MAVVTMKMEITADNLATIIANLPVVAKETSAVFLLPNDRQDKQEDLLIWIRGSIDSVYKARLALTVLPLFLSLFIYIFTCHVFHVGAVCIQGFAAHESHVSRPCR